MPQLDPTWFASQLFWLAIFITVLYVALSRAILPGLMGIIELRQETRGRDIGEAQALKEQAEKAREEYETALADARARSQALLAEAEKANRDAAEKAGAELNRTLSKQVAEAERRIVAKKDELLASLSPAVAELASQVVDKLAGLKVDSATAAKHVQPVKN